MGEIKTQLKKWQLWLSYFYPIRVETIESEINETLEIFVNKGHFQLCTERAVYSYEKKYDNFRKLFDKMYFNGPDGQNVLILGLGLGSIIQLLIDKSEKFRFTAVEIDESIIHLAEKYILHNLDINLSIICADGFSFINSCTEKFDMVCMDIYIDDWIPEEFVTSEFCEGMKNLLTPTGTVIYNCPAFNRYNVSFSNRFFNNIFKKSFPEALIMDVHKNYMLLSNRNLLQGQ